MRVLIADFDLDHNRNLSGILEQWGVVVKTAGAEDVATQLTAFGPDVVLTSFPIASSAKVPVILMTAFGSAEQAAEAVEEHGAFWFLEKPVTFETLRVLLARAAQHGRLLTENARFGSQHAAPNLPISVGMTIEEAERVLLEATLSDRANNKTHAARALGISAKTLHQKLRQYRLEDVRSSSSGEPRNAEPRNAEPRNARA